MWERRAFTVGDREYLWLDIVLAAMWGGEWDPFERCLRESLACEAYSDETDDPADQDAVDAAMSAFRYDRELITAEETEAWLAKADLTVDSWSRFFTRQHLHARWHDRLRDIVTQCPPADADVLADLPAEGICSGAFRRMANALAGQAAVTIDDLQQTTATAIDRDGACAGIDAVIAAHQRLFPPLGDAEYYERLTHIAALERHFDARRRAALTPEALQAQIDTSRLDWMVVDLERLPFPEVSMVKETLLCCREENLTLAQLASRIDRRVLTERVRLDTCEPDLAALLLSAEPANILGPLHADDGFQALVVGSKTLPEATDPDVRPLAEQAVTTALVRRARVLHVQWHYRT